MAPQITQNQELYLKKAVLTAMQISYQDEDDIAAQFAARIKKLDNNEHSIFTREKSGQTYYAIIFSGNGLWGTITGILAVNENVSRIIGVDIISHNETPGLGGRIDETYFKEQFRNEKIINNQISIKKQVMVIKIRKTLKLMLSAALPEHLIFLRL